MEFKNTPLRDIETVLWKANKTRAKAHHDVLCSKAIRDHIQHNLIIQAPGNSNAEKEHSAKASQEWLKASLDHARAEGVWTLRDGEFGIIEKEYYAQKMELEMNDSTIKRG